jgi:hypothetical protein
MSATTETAIPSLRCLSKQTAEREGYKAITTPICARREADIFRSVQAGLKGTDSVWIEVQGDQYSAARKASDLREITEIEALLTTDQRRDFNREGIKP